MVTYHSNIAMGKECSSDEQTFVGGYPSPGGLGVATGLASLPKTCPAWLNPPGTKVPTGRASIIIKAHKPPHHVKLQHSVLGRSLEIQGQCFRVMPSYCNLGAQLKGRSIRTNWAARKATPQSKYLHFYRGCTSIIKIFTWSFPTYLKCPSAGMKSV